MRGIRWVFAMGLCLAGCPQKVPYPTVRKSPSQAQPPAGLSDRAAGKVDPAATSAETPSKGPEEPVTASWHGALLWTPEGTVRVKAASQGKDLSSRLLAGQWVRVTGGEVRGVRVQVETRKAHPKGKESQVLQVQWQGGGERREISLDAWTERPDLAEAARADPDLAPEFFHRERLLPLGADGARLVFLLSVDGYLGGAHPYAVRRLLVLDVDRGAWVQDRDPGEATRLARQVLGNAWETSCLRRPAGIAEVSGRGGQVRRVLGLTHEMESCAGKFRAVEIGTKDPSEDTVGPDREGRWVLEEALAVAPVADWRQFQGRRWTVLVMGRDRQDRVAPVERAMQAEAPREVLWWEPGMARPLPVGRAPRLLEVQFLEELPREWSGIFETAPAGQKGSGGGGIGEGS